MGNSKLPDSIRMIYRSIQPEHTVWAIDLPWIIYGTPIALYGVVPSQSRGGLGSTLVALPGASRDKV